MYNSFVKPVRYARVLNGSSRRAISEGVLRLSGGVVGWNMRNVLYTNQDIVDDSYRSLA